jgi:hypothetical protein
MQRRAYGPRSIAPAGACLDAAPLESSAFEMVPKISLPVFIGQRPDNQQGNNKTKVIKH